MDSPAKVKGALRRLHYGPGPHPSGSPQSVHAGNGTVSGRSAIIEQLKKGNFSNDLINEYWGKEKGDNDYWITEEEVAQFLKDQGASHFQIQDVIQFMEFYKDKPNAFDPFEAQYLYHFRYGTARNLETLNLDLESIRANKNINILTGLFFDEHGQQDFESALVLDRNGNVALEKDGGKNSVRWEVSESIRAHNGVLIHNHPSSGGLSSQDAYYAIEWGLDEIHAIGKDGNVFTLRINPDLSIKERSLLKNEFIAAKREVKWAIDNEYIAEIFSNRKAWTESDANGLMALERKYPNLIDYEAIGYDHYDFSESIDDWEDTSK